jgi:hypothetical protein
MKPRIAISAPMSVPMEHLSEVEDLLYKKYDIPFGHISFWNRKSEYDQRAFDQSEAIVVILNDFAFDSSNIPVGVHRELRDADKQHKKVFLAYKRKSDGALNLYTANYILGRGNDFQSTMIKGVAGAFDPFKDWLNDISHIESTIKKWEATGFNLSPNKNCESSVLISDPFVIDAQEERERRESEIRLLKGHIDVSEKWDAAARKIMFPVNVSGAPNTALPEMRRVYATTIPVYSDERLLLML